MSRRRRGDFGTFRQRHPDLTRAAKVGGSAAVAAAVAGGKPTTRRKGVASAKLRHPSSHTRGTTPAPSRREQLSRNRVRVGRGASAAVVGRAANRYIPPVSSEQRFAAAELRRAKKADRQSRRGGGGRRYKRDKRGRFA